MTPRADLEVAALEDLVVNDVTASYWIKQAYLELKNRDPVDAINDLEILSAIFNHRCEQALRKT